MDSSSLILLAKIGALDKIIDNMKDKIIIPEEVYNESVKKKNTFDAKLIEARVKMNKIDRKKIKNMKVYRKIKEDFNLGDGEAECITLCIEYASDLIADDRKAINICKILKIRYTTAPNIIVKLYTKRIIKKQEAENYIKKLEEYGRYSKEIITITKEKINNETHE